MSLRILFQHYLAELDADDAAHLRFKRLVPKGLENLWDPRYCTLFGNEIELVTTLLMLKRDVNLHPHCESCLEHARHDFRLGASNVHVVLSMDLIVQ